jgi:hypothetical protein
MLKANLLLPSGGSGAGAELKDGSLASIWNKPFDETSDRAKAYSGRVLRRGDYVLIKRNPRSRQKSDPWWGNVSKITDRVGITTYRVFDGNRVSIREIDHLKSASLREEHLRAQQINPDVKRQAELNFGKIGSCDLIFDNLEPNVSRTWRGKTVWVGYPGIVNMDAVVNKLREGKFRVAYVIFPELECEAWYRKLDKLHGADWHGCEPAAKVSFWVDELGNRCGTSLLCWWVIKVVGRSH